MTTSVFMHLPTINPLEKIQEKRKVYLKQQTNRVNSTTPSTLEKKIASITKEIFANSALGYFFGALGLAGSIPAKNLALYTGISTATQFITTPFFQKILRCTPDTIIRNLASISLSGLTSRTISNLTCSYLGYPINDLSLFMSISGSIQPFTSYTARKLTGNKSDLSYLNVGIIGTSFVANNCLAALIMYQMGYDVDFTSIAYHSFINFAINQAALITLMMSLKQLEELINQDELLKEPKKTQV